MTFHYETCELCGGSAIVGTVCPKAVTCPTCNAKPTSPCRRPSGHHAVSVHKKRIELAEGMTAASGQAVEFQTWPTTTQQELDGLKNLVGEQLHADEEWEHSPEKAELDEEIHRLGDIIEWQKDRVADLERALFTCARQFSALHQDKLTKDMLAVLGPKAFQRLADRR